jgi:asparagine synthase (glutamine-hydrolysing)
LFAFASEIKALLTLVEVSDEIDELEVARHLVIPVEDDLGATYYRDIRKVKPAHELTVSADGIRERRYWSLDPDRSLVLGSDAEYAEAVREQFLEAVRCRLRASGKVASMLSGGLDSSSITCAAAGLLEECGHEPPLMTLSAVYDRASASDEREFMHEVSRAFAVRPLYFSADSVSPIAEIDLMNRLLDGANDAGNLYLNWNLYRMAAAHGANVVLDGFDGDTTLSHGVGRFVELAHGLRWWTMAREVSSYAKSTGYAQVDAARWAWAHGIKPAIRTRIGREPQGARVPRLGSWANLLTPDYGARLVPRLAASPRPPKTERQEHFRLLERPLMMRAVSGIEAMGAGAGVEVRLPFFDVRLVELCLSLPADQKLRKGWSRLVMRNAMQGILPEKIRWRAGKANVSIGFRLALQTLGTRKVEEVMKSTNAELGRFVNTGFLRDTLPRFMADEVSMQEEVRFWKVFSLALWLMGRSGAENVGDGSHSIAYGSSTIRRRQTQQEVPSA